MNQSQAQSSITSILRGDDDGIEHLIAAAIAFNPAAKEPVEDARKVSGPLSGLGAVAVRYACQGATNAETCANMIALAENL